MSEHQTIARQAVRGSIYNISAAGITLVLGLIRSILLTRLLLPEYFGVVAFATFYVALAAQLTSFGFDQALIHRQAADDSVRNTYFGLRFGSASLTLILLVIAAPIISRLHPEMPLLGWLILAVGSINTVGAMSYVQETILSKELAFRQLTTIDVTASLVMTIVAPTLAWVGAGVWALVAEQASGILTRVFMSWFVFRRWVPRFGWDRSIASWFLAYGKSAFVASNLGFLTARFDDFWIGTTINDVQLGYYSRAYEYAQYPRRLVANTFINVFGPIFARLQDDRLRLSQAFYRAAYLILRLSILVSGAFALVMPEFIHILIGDRWLPMLPTFRLMLIYTLLDSLMQLCGALLFAAGRPRQVQFVVMAQAAAFIPGVIVFTSLWGINGAALAMNIMLAAGGIVMYLSLRRVIDFSINRLFLWPLIAFLAAGVAGAFFESVWQPTNVWFAAAGKLLLFGGVFSITIFLGERRDALQAIRWFQSILKSRKQAKPA